MSKLDSQSTSLTVSPVSVPGLASSPLSTRGVRGESGRRLIVLVPTVEADLAPAAQRVWMLANAMGARVQFIGLYTDAAREPGLKRELVTLAAMVKDERVPVEAEIIFGTDWVHAVKSRAQPGDVIVCFAEQRVGVLRRPLSQILQADLGLPLFIFSGLYPQNDSRSTWLIGAAAWGGSIAIIVGFFLLQVRIDHLIKDWVHMILPMLSIPAEVWMIWAWNNLFA